MGYSQDFLDKMLAIDLAEGIPYDMDNGNRQEGRPERALQRAVLTMALADLSKADHSQNALAWINRDTPDTYRDYYSFNGICQSWDLDPNYLRGLIQRDIEALTASRAISHIAGVYKSQITPPHERRWQRNRRRPAKGEAHESV
jgi:hypothetical protein